MEEIFNKYHDNVRFHPSVEDIQKSHTLYFKAMHEGNWVGTTGFYYKTPMLAETVKTIVFPEYRGMGLGEAISWSIEEECKKRGIKKISSCIYIDNIAMITIKLKQGYIVEGIHRDHDAPGYHEYSLGKLLT